MVALIEIQDLNITVNGKHILKNINLDINESQSIGIIGKSGAGKTTLSKIIAGIMERDSGKVDVRIGDMWVDMTEKGTDFRGRAKPHIGYLHQEYSLYPHRNVLSNLTDENIVYEILEKTPYELSVGERQRITMAQVLIKEPEIILFDEPTGTMDPITWNDILKKRKDMHQKCKFMECMCFWKMR